ncbi:unnamed protein product [Adineta steineri]|uniref:Uncharacterized protein n=1 Tax=Adineta steineri TaxID=433720 RepID=A0A814CVA7_9BILA|nr:unnamed protein product [Adineta steineri]CAF1182072.1 unnamed protein product [Adineta steineri]CAF1193205.1 unnamed protein product [Adineta steineri]
MQILSYAQEKNITISKIGISKPPCKNCEENLESSKVEHEHAEDGNQNPKNFEDPRAINTKRLATIKNSTFKWVVQNSLPRNANEVKEAAKKSAELRMMFNCTVNSATLLDMYDNYDREAWARHESCFANKGSYQSDRTWRKGAYARAGLYQASTGGSVIDARVNLLCASANAEVSMAGVSAGFKFILASVELNVGPVHLSCGLKASTGFAVGVDGIEVQFLGTGFTVGPKKIRLSISVLDLEMNPNAVVAALFISISNEFHSDFKVDDDDVFKSLMFAIAQFLHGGPPPPPAGACAAITIEKPRKSAPIELMVAQPVRQPEWLTTKQPKTQTTSSSWNFNILEYLFPKQKEQNVLTH